MTGLLSVLSPQGLLWGCRSWRTAPWNGWEDPGKQNGTLVQACGGLFVRDSELSQKNKPLLTTHISTVKTNKLSLSGHLGCDHAGSWFGRLFKDPCQSPALLLKRWNMKTLIVNHHLQITGWDVTRQTTRVPSKWFLLIDFHSWQITSSPRLGLIPEQTTEYKRRVTQTQSESKLNERLITVPHLSSSPLLVSESS